VAVWIVNEVPVGFAFHDVKGDRTPPPLLRPHEYLGVAENPQLQLLTEREAYGAFSVTIAEVSVDGLNLHSLFSPK